MRFRKLGLSRREAGGFRDVGLQQDECKEQDADHDFRPP